MVATGYFSCVQLPLLWVWLCFLLYTCTPNPSPIQPLPPIELSFKPLPMDDLYIELEGRDSTKPLDLQEELLTMTVKNNAYDTLFVYLLKSGKKYVYYSDVISYYIIVNDSLVNDGSQIRCFFGSDSICFVLKGKTETFNFDGKCEGRPFSNNVIFEYNFSFKADSLGMKKYPKFMQFPCKNTRHIKTR